MSFSAPRSPRRRRLTSRALAVLAAVVLTTAATAHAQEEPDADGDSDVAGRVLLVFSGTRSDVAALENVAPRFQAPVLEQGEVRFAGNKETERLFASCGEELGVGAEGQRDCRLAAANRSYVAHVLEISARDAGKRRWDLTLQVWDPLANELVFTTMVQADGRTVEDAARDQLAGLGAQYVCFRGTGRACKGGVLNVDGGGLLEISNISPAPLTVLVNGVEIGPAPNEFRNLPTGEVTLTLRQAGYQDLVQVVTLSEDEPLVLTGLTLEPMPAGIEVIAEVDGLAIFVDGERRGTTAAGQIVEIPTQAGAFEVAVGGNGWTMHREHVDLAPGARSSIRPEVEDAAPFVASCASAEPPDAESACTTACESGDGASCARFGLMLYTGQTGGADFKRARIFFDAACVGGNLQSCNNLGFMSEKGQGGDRNLDAARTLYEQACTGGALEGCYNLGVMYQRGQGVASNGDRARELYEAACDGGEGRACYQLADMLFRGEGLPADVATASLYFERACDAGTLGGCTNLAFMLESGQDLTRDVDRAVVLYRRACDGGEPGACYNLGYLMAAGEKVARDVATARGHFEQACELGLQNACLALQNLEP